jgi:hypothetical protein
MAADLKFVELCARQIVRVAKMIKLLSKNRPYRFDSGDPTNHLTVQVMVLNLKCFLILSFGRRNRNRRFVAC